MNKHIVWAALLTGLLSGATALANHHGSGSGAGHKAGMHSDSALPMFGKFDKNNDGRISRTEARDGADRMFTEMDVDKDGFVSAEEMRAHHAAMRDTHGGMMREHWKAADTDGDGALSRTEAEASKMTMMARDFDKFDQNKDGRLTQDEIKAAMQSHKPGKHHKE